MRTIVDMAELVDPYELIGPLHQAGRRSLLRTRQLDILRRRLRNRRHGYAALRFALGQLHAGSTGILSHAELVLAQAIRDSGLPLPLVNVVMHTERGRFKIDLYWPDLGIAIEVDDFGHDLLAMRHLDATRNEALGDLDIDLLRVPNELVFQAIEVVIAEIAAMCARAARRG